MKKKQDGNSFLSALLVLITYFIVRQIKDSPSMPKLSNIFQSAVQIFLSGSFYVNLGYTVKIVVAGVLIAFIFGSVLAVACSMNKHLYSIVMPIVNSTKNVPSIALFPLFIVLMGIGDTPRIFVIIWNSIYPIISSTLAGIKYTAVVWQTMFQFPQNQKWLKEHGPNGLIFQQINRPNIEDLQNDKELLFSETKNADNTYMKYKWNAQKKYLVKQKFDLFVTGRRIAESNNCGKKSDNFIRKGNVYDSFSPIATWTTEDVFAYLKYNNIELPWQYVNTINGFAYGSVAWTERRRFGHLYATMKERLEEVYDANKNVLIDLRNNIPEIDAFLKEKGI